MKSEKDIWLDEYHFLTRRLDDVKRHLKIFYGVNEEDLVPGRKKRDGKGLTLSQQIENILDVNKEMALSELVFFLDPAREKDRAFKQVVSNALVAMSKKGKIIKVIGDKAKQVKWKRAYNLDTLKLVERKS